MTVVIGTAGHIDHGKTALLRALTGIDADRLPEERRRGMTIDVGYAHLRLPDGTDLDFVDVPGHDRLIGNMLTGAGEIDAVLLVVAADDGPRAQTIEHLGLLDALGIDLGIVALTKVDAVDSRRVAEVERLIRELLTGTSLGGSPITPVSSIDGRGLPELSAALTTLRDRALAARPPTAGENAPVRLAIDRSFVIKGRGTVVTGTLRGGRLAQGTQLRLVPGDREVRAREVQVHGGRVASLAGGGRVALNLAAIEAADLPRGAVLTTDPGIQASNALVVVVQSDGITPGALLRMHLGTEQVRVRVGRGRTDLVPAPAGAITRLRLARPIAVAAGDHFVLRGGASNQLVVGGVVVDPQPPVGPSRRRATADLLAGVASPDPMARARSFVGLHGVLDRRQLVELAGPEAGRGTPKAWAAVSAASWLVAEPIAGLLEADALAAVSARAGSLSVAELRTRLARLLRRLATVDPRAAATIADDLVAGIVARGDLARNRDQVLEPGRFAGPAPAVLAAMERLERTLATAGPPSLAEAVRATGCPPAGVRALEAAGRIVRLDADLAYASGTYEALTATALRLARSGALSPAALRDATGTSRKFVMAILEDLDRRGILRRTPAGHVPGPRAGLVDLGQAE
ncbi:MAG TPA: selenocysteine-specific translation elongation factor [Candidatus Limnocylindrales bacterium]|jgi:selenocysteine-specific elongation factor